MATSKQFKANQQNAKKSTGPKTQAGKEAVSKNAIKHGIFSKRAIIEGESSQELYQLIADLVVALEPVGALEELLVEKVGLVFWKQQRLIAAESARIELQRDARRASFRLQIEDTLGIVYPTPKVNPHEMLELDLEELEHLEWCKAILLEYSSIEYEEPVGSEDILPVLPCLPVLQERLMSIAASKELTLPECADQYEGGLLQWMIDVAEQCNEDMKALQRHRSISTIAALVRTANSAPVEMETLARYQTGLDSELYKAINVLSKQQKWRMRVESTNQSGGFTGEVDSV